MTDNSIVEEGEDFFEPSDEELANMSESDFIGSIKEKEEVIEPEEKEVEPEEEDTDEEITEENEEPENEEPEEAKEADLKETDTDTPIDYEAEYKRLMAPFKANGRMITPKSPEDAIRFLQMGANYHEKMAGMKPALKTLKALENNGLLDEEKINFLIDINKGNPEAISKLLKETNIDPLDVDVKTETTYKPSDYSVSDTELELDSVLDDIKSSPNYAKTLTTVTKEWDDNSRNQAGANPNIIRIINRQMDSGVYDTVMEAVKYDRSIGNLKGLSDLEAYKTTGNRLEQEGVFNSVNSGQNTDVNSTVTQTNQKTEQKRKAQKKAAGPTKTTTKKVNKLPSDFNPLDLSDEEFEKFDPKRLGL